MKTIIFTTLLLINCIVSFGQKKFILNGRVSTQLPVGTQSITKTQALQLIDKNFNANKIATSSMSKRNADQIYIIDNVIVSLKVHDQIIKPNYIQDLKGSLEEFSKGDDAFKLYTKFFDDYVVLVTTSKYSNDVKAYDFYSVNNHHNTAVTGTIQFALNDKAKAETILNGIISNLKFKVQ